MQQDPRPITLTVKGLTPSEQLRLQTLDLRELALRPLLETAELQVIEAQRAGSDDLVPLHELAKYEQERIENIKEHFQLRRREGKLVCLDTCLLIRYGAHWYLSWCRHLHCEPLKHPAPWSGRSGQHQNPQAH